MIDFGQVQSMLSQTFCSACFHARPRVAKSISAAQIAFESLQLASYSPLPPKYLLCAPLSSPFIRSTHSNPSIPHRTPTLVKSSGLRLHWIAQALCLLARPISCRQAKLSGKTALCMCCSCIRLPLTSHRIPAPRSTRSLR